MKEFIEFVLAFLGVIGLIAGVLLVMGLVFTYPWLLVMLLLVPLTFMFWDRWQNELHYISLWILGFFGDSEKSKSNSN